jgi:hypothetical protein
MRDDLVQLALRHGSSVLADHLKASIKRMRSINDAHQGY